MIGRVRLALGRLVVASLTLKLACWDYDRTRGSIDGRVQLAGIDLDISVMRPREAFTRMLESAIIRCRGGLACVVREAQGRRG
jgi:hypothetical protein